MRISILVVEDDPAISGVIRLTLEMSQYMVTIIDDGAMALERIRKGLDQLAILDIMLPNVDGYALLEAAKMVQMPTIFVTAKAELADRVNGLRLGTDDYLVKPFEPLELLARVENILRRTRPNSEIFQITKDVTIHFGQRIVTKRGKQISLTPKEYELLELFSKHPNIPLSRDQLLDRLWGYDYFGNTRTVDVHVLKLRTKLGLEEVIQTVHKIGYRLVVQNECES